MDARLRASVRKLAICAAILKRIEGEMLTVGKIQVHNFKYVWTIGDFMKKTKCNKHDYVYVSPTFVVSDIESSEEILQWVIALYSFGNNLEPKHICLIAMQLSSDPCMINNYRVKLAFLNNAGQEVYVRDSGVTEMPESKMWKHLKFISEDDFLEDKDTLLVNGALSIVLEVQYNSDSNGNFNTKTILNDDFESMFTSGRYSDLTIMVGDQKIKAHRNILASRSKVFSDMFDRDTEENDNNNNNSVIVINDVSYNVMNELLRFMYSGKICNRNINFVKSLLVAADKYGVDSLKVLCENILCENLGMRNVCELLAVADQHNCSKLKTLIMIFMIKNFKLIKSTLSYKKLQDFHPQLAQEVLVRTADNKDKLKNNINAVKN